MGVTISDLLSAQIGLYSEAWIAYFEASIEAIDFEISIRQSSFESGGHDTVHPNFDGDPTNDRFLNPDPHIYTPDDMVTNQIDAWEIGFDANIGQECFPAGTPISLADGSTKPIEDIQINDTVLAPNGLGELVSAKVDKLFTNTTQEFIRLSFEDGREPLVATSGHRFLTETGDYMEIGHMARLGGGTVRVVGVDGGVVMASAETLVYSAKTADMFPMTATKTIAFEGSAVLKQDVTEGWTTYNFEVREYHTYVAGGVRVHNDSILSTLQEGDTLVALNDDLTDMAVLRDVNGDGTADFVTLDGYRRDGEPTEIALTRVYYWNAANGDLATLLGNIVDNAPDATGNVFDPGNGNTWNDMLERLAA